MIQIYNEAVDGWVERKIVVHVVLGMIDERREVRLATPQVVSFSFFAIYEI